MGSTINVPRKRGRCVVAINLGSEPRKKWVIRGLNHGGKRVVMKNKERDPGGAV